MARAARRGRSLHRVGLQFNQRSTLKHSLLGDVNAPGNESSRSTGLRTWRSRPRVEAELLGGISSDAVDEFKAGVKPLRPTIPGPAGSDINTVVKERDEQVAATSRSTATRFCSPDFSPTRPSGPKRSCITIAGAGP
jgi:hypothetical protein